MCQSRADGGRRCPSHRRDTMALLRMLSYKPPHYTITLFHDMFIDLRRTYRGTQMDEEEIFQLSEEVGEELAQNYGSYDVDSHVADPATLQAQMKLLSERRIVSLEIEHKIAVKAGQSFEEAADIFNYLYNHAEDFPEPSIGELEAARRDLVGSPLVSLKRAVTAYALLSSDDLFVSSASPTLKTIPRIPELMRIDTLGSPITHGGYAPATDEHDSRLEIILRNDANTRLIYKNVTEEQWEDIQAGGSQATAAITAIRSDLACRHPSTAEAQRHEHTDESNNGVNRCEYCGEFTGDNLHFCRHRVLKREVLDAIAHNTSGNRRSELDSIEHTDIDGNFRPREEYSFPILPDYSSSDDSSDGSVNRGTTTRLVTRREARNIEVVLIRKLPHQALLQFLEASDIPSQYDEKDQVMFRGGTDRNSEAEFIAYLPQSANTRIFKTNDGIFLQQVGVPEPESLTRLHTSNSRPLNTRWASSNGNDSFTSSLFPSVYELSTAHSRRSFNPFVNTDDKWTLPPLTEIYHRLNDDEFVSFHFEHDVKADLQGRFLDDHGHAYEQDFYKDSTPRIETRKVSAEVSIGRDLDGNITVLGFAGGECSTCYDNGKCSHVGYALRQLPFIVKDQITRFPADKIIEEKTAGLPYSLRNCHLTANEEGKTTLTFPRAAAAVVVNNRLFTEGDDQHQRYAYASQITAPHPTRIVRAASVISQGDDIVIPMQAKFSSLYTSPNEFAHNALVEGTVTYTKDADGNLVSKTRNLKCNCDVYQRNYRCRHTNRVEARENALLAPLEGELVSSEREVTQETDDKVAAMRVQDRASAIGEDVPNWSEALEQVQQERVMSYSELNEISMTYSRKFQEEKNRILRLQDAKDMALFAEQKQRMAIRYAEFDGVRYFENYPAFEEELKRVRAKLKSGEDPLGYETRNVLNGIGDDIEHGRKFGVELEVVFPDDKYKSSRAFANELSQMGLTPTALIQGYHAGQESGWADWSVEEDSTVDLEVVSPIMSDTSENWAQIQKVCDLIKKHGGTANYKTGSHVHISTGDYGRTAPAHAALLDEFARYSDILYRLGSNPKAAKHRGTRWCKQNITDADSEIRSDDLEVKDFSTVASYLNAHHSKAINMEASGVGMKSHTEIRLWDGTLDPKLVQMQVMLTAAMTEVASQRVDSISGESFRFSPQSELMPLGSALKSNYDNDEEETAKFREMLDRYFPRETDRKRFIGLWAMTKWQEEDDQKSWNED